jgi:hypothetical protein
MTKAQGTIRTYPGGAASVGLTVSIKRESDDTEITTDTTDAEGQWQYSADGSPGPWYWTATDAAEDPDVIRAGSSKSYGTGGAYSLYELAYALRVMGDGVIEGFLNELEVTYDAAGLDLDINTGGVLAAGVPAIFYGATDFTDVGIRDATHPKACYLVVEVTPPGQAEEGKAELASVCGTAAASPALPTLTNDETLRQIALASYRLPNTSSTTLTDLVDLRSYLLDPDARNPIVTGLAERTDPAVEATTTSTTGADATWVAGSPNTTLLDGVVYDIDAIAFVVGKVTAGQSWSISPYIGSTSQLASYVSATNEEYMGLMNVHSRTGIVGDGSALNNGLRIKVSGGTMTYQVGFLQVRAVPRS